jgi:hypothetical protein
VSSQEFLIGKDNQTLMMAREVVEPDPLGLMITKMKLGWIVHGGNNGGSSQEAIVHICCEEHDDDLHLIAESLRRKGCTLK